MKVPISVRALPPLTFRAWLTPPPIGAKTLLRDREATADLTTFRAGDVTGFEVGSGPLVLALHGWGGRPAQMAPVARALAAAGWRVAIPELPGHAGGDVTDIKQGAAALRMVLEHVGAPEVVVGHSFASMVMRLAFAESAPPSVILIAPALDVNDAVQVFGDRLRLLPWARRGLRRRLEAWDPDLWPSVSGVRPDQMPGTEMVIIHDPADDETPFIRSAELAAIRPLTSIAVVDGVGHTRILSDPDVMDRVVASVRERSPRRSP
jgi:pimeloyl-ACP methyl ester carboxylesterase